MEYFMKCLVVLHTVSLLLGLSAVASLAAPPQTTSTAVPSVALRVGDILDIQVSGEPSMSKSYTIDGAGRITFDLVGQLVAVGRTPDQLASELRTRLGRYLKQPTITVSQSAPTVQEVVVTGEVSRPGSVKLRPGDGLLDAMAVVGGLTPAADGTHATLVRRGQSQPQPINVELLIKGDLRQNLTLNDGDIIQVPKRQIPTFRVVGEVRQPGDRPFPEEGAVTLLGAILAAGGVSERADRSQVTLTRKGQTPPVMVDLDQVLAGETTANVAIQAGDVISVGARMIVQVAGEVRAPHELLLRNGGTLLEAVLLAGGFTPEADRSALQITHHDGKTDTVSVADVTTIVGGPALRPGDLVMVGRAKPEVVTVTGAVRSQGQLRYQKDMKITDALMAAGLAENAQWKEIRLIRGEDGANRKIVVFNLESYLKAPQTVNVPLQAGDQVFVAARRQGSGRNVLRSLMEVLPLANIFFLR
jgi:polysaccharide export outer membrane protein